MAETISKHIAEGFGKGELYAALAYDATDVFSGMKIKALMLNSTGRISFLDATSYIYSSVTTQLDIVSTTIALAGICSLTGATTVTGALTVGVSDTGHDVIFYGATAANYLHWDESGDDLLLVGTATQFAIAGDTDASNTTSGSLRTAGGLGVVKAAYIGGLLDVAGVATFAAQDIHTLGLTVADAKAVVQGMNTFPKLTPTILTSGAGYTMTAAQMLSGLIRDTSATGAIAATLPTVANVVALIGGYVAGTSFYLDYSNPGNQTVTLTVDASAQWTMTGTMTIATTTHRRFLCVINSATTGTVYSLGDAAA